VSFSYSFDSNPTVAYCRLLVFDTVYDPPNLPIWQDEEIAAVLALFNSQNNIIGLSGYYPAIPPTQQFSYLRAAATLLRGLAAQQGRMATVGLLDAKVNGPAAAAALRAIADDYIQQEENGGYFAVAEMVQDAFSMRERLWKMLYRTQNT
jgi:hypothetical protein